MESSYIKFLQKMTFCKTWWRSKTLYKVYSQTMRLCWKEIPNCRMFPVTHWRIYYKTFKNIILKLRPSLLIFKNLCRSLIYWETHRWFSYKKLYVYLFKYLVWCKNCIVKKFEHLPIYSHIQEHFILLIVFTSAYMTEITTNMLETADIGNTWSSMYHIFW